MAKFTKFGLSNTGELVYRSSGKLAPSSYTVRGSTVYGKDGRKIGQIGKGTKKEQATIRRASTRRREGARPLYKAPKKVGERKIRQVFEDIRKKESSELHSGRWAWIPQFSGAQPGHTPEELEKVLSSESTLSQLRMTVH